MELFSHGRFILLWNTWLSGETPVLARYNTKITLHIFHTGKRGLEIRHYQIH